MNAPAILSFLLIGTSALAESSADLAANLKVYLLEDASGPGLNSPWARTIASQILGEAGVHIKWELGAPRHDQGQAAIIIDLSSNTPEKLAPRALAYAQVYEGVHIRVFWDRVRNTVSGANPDSTFLLAHVMAHEITHVLEGMDHHSKAGLMKPSWTKNEIQQMSIRPLLLAPEDVQLIHLGLLKR